MAGTITALKVQKKRRDRVSVYLDGRFAFGLPAIVAARLKPGLFLSDAEIEALQEQGGSEEAYNQALDYLAYRPRSRAEVVAHLSRRGWTERQIEQVAERLERAGLLDDQAFARFWIENREQFRPKGARALRYELRGKGLSDEVIAQALGPVDMMASAYRSAEKKAHQLAHLERPVFMRRLMDYLVRRGFDYDVAQEVAERCWTEVTAEVSTNYEPRPGI